MLKIISLALEEVGYAEKETNANLDNEVENAGDSNYTKYARDLDAIEGFYNGRKQRQPWCATFVDWLFVQAYGVEKAKAMTYHSELGARCDYAANAYRVAGRWYSTPEVGDEIFFKSASYAHAHTGIVVEVTPTAVVTVEGNTCPTQSVVYNGGEVCKKSYALDYHNIIGYGRPNYESEESMVQKRVYMSPAYHRFNPCAIDGCDETTHNNLYMDEVEKFLTACGIAWKRGPRRVPKSAEDGDALMRQAVAESNAFKADIHYVSHTNASTNLSDGIGNGKAKGCRPIIYKGSARGEKLAEYMIARRREVYDGAITLNRRTDLYELRVPEAVSFYEEHVFHDNPEDAQWFHGHMKDVARSAVQGMCDYLGVPFVEPTEDEVVDGYCVSMADYMALKDELKAEKVKAAEELAAADACIERVRSALKAYDNGKD